MTQELMYTSAPRGLKPGTQGFCTVVCTQGMSGNLALQLEGLSAYRHLFPPGTPQADHNPVAYSHLCLRIGSTKYHVLSRISSAGFDYSRRSNKFAHHVVLSEKELPDRGPAWLLTQPGFMETRWDGQVKVLPTGRRIPVDPGPAGPPRSLAWEKLTGDAGWSGVLAETALRSQSARLICPVGLDPLPLLAEALALLPPELRWKVTFSTYFTGLPSGLECQWQCVFAGTPEELPARRSRDALVIDLTQPLPSLPESAPVQAARQAQMLPLPEPSRAAAQPTLLTQSVPVSTPSWEEHRPVQAYDFPQVPISPLPPLESRSRPAEVPLPTAVIHGFAPKKSSQWPIILVSSAIALLLGITVGIMLPRGPEVAVKPNEGSREKSIPEPEPPPPGSSGKKEKSKSEPTPPGSSGNETGKQKPPTPPGSAEKKEKSKSELPQPDPAEKKEEKPGETKSPESSKRPADQTKSSTTQHPAPTGSKPTASPSGGGETPKQPPSPESQQPPEKPPQPQAEPLRRLWMSIPNPSLDGGENSPPLLEDKLFGQDIQLELIPEKLEQKKDSLSLPFHWRQDPERKGRWSIGKSDSDQSAVPIAYFTVEAGKLHFEWDQDHTTQQNEYQAALGDALLLVKRGDTLLGYVQLRAAPPKVLPIELGNRKLPRLGNIQTKVSPQDLKIFIQLRNEKEKSVIVEAKPPLWNLSIPHNETGCELRITIELKGDVLLWKPFTFIDNIALPLDPKTLEKKDIEAICKYIEQGWDEQINKRKMAEETRENYQKVATWLESLAKSEIHYAIYHEVKDSQGKSYRVYVAVSDEGMLSEEPPPKEK